MYNLGNADKNLLISEKASNKYYDEDIIIDINDKNNTHSIIAKYINPGSRCLDVGCGSGYIGKLLSEKNCEVYGIDTDEEALKIAQKNCGYKKVMNFNISNESDERYKKFFDNNMKFDYIIFADVLEHLIEPDKAIVNFLRKLSINGEILTSIPNIAHLDIVKGIMNRNFNYNKIGILDSTHLRFFTKNSFIDFINKINEVYKQNLNVKNIGKTINTPYYVDDYVNINSVLNDDNELMVLQYVYSIKKSKNIIQNKAKPTKDYYRIIDDIISENIKKEEDINEMQQEIINTKNRIKEVEKNNVLLKNELENEKNINQNIMNSKSWKITKPLRKITSILKK